MLLFALQLCVYVPSMIKNFIYQLKNNFLKKSLPCGGKWIHVYVWLSPFTVHLKLQHFSSTMRMLSCFSCVRLPTRLPCPWVSPGKNTGVGRHDLLQGDLPNPGIEPMSLTSPALEGRFFTTSTTWEALIGYVCMLSCFSHV